MVAFPCNERGDSNAHKNRQRYHHGENRIGANRDGQTVSAVLTRFHIALGLRIPKEYWLNRCSLQLSHFSILVFPFICSHP
jgi:hypothetical protein